MSQTTEFVISVNPDEPAGDYRHDLAWELASDLKELDAVSSVTQQSDSRPTPGAKGLSIDPGVIIATIALTANIVTIAEIFRQWLSRDRGGRSCTITVGDKTMTLVGLNKQSHEELLTILKAELQAQSAKSKE